MKKGNWRSYNVPIGRCNFRNQLHTESSVRGTLGEALYPGCKTERPAAMQLKHRYDLNDLYAMFLEYWDSEDRQPQRGLIVLCVFCKKVSRYTQTSK